MKRFVSLFLTMVMMISMVSFIPTFGEQAVATTGTPEPTVAPTATPIPTPTPGGVPQDFSQLISLRDQALALYNLASQNIGTEPGQYTQAKVTALYNAIQSSAWNGNDPIDQWTPQSGIDAACNRLQAGIEACTPNPPTPIPTPTPTPTATPTPIPTPTPTPIPTQMAEITPTPPTFSYGDFVCRKEGSRIIILEYNGTGGEVTIPSVINGSSEIIIGSAFSDCTGLTGITITNSVISIDAWAFSGCTGLTNITIPSSVTYIGRRAFSDCTGLKDIAILSGVTGIGAEAFLNCIGLTSIIIPSSVTSIDTGAFRGCTGLTDITIPNSVTRICSFTFYRCTSLTGITIPNSATRIDDYAFYGCTSLTDVAISSSVTYIGDRVFSYCTGLTSVTIPSSVTRIDTGTFSGCTNLTINTTLGSYAASYAVANSIPVSYIATPTLAPVDKSVLAAKLTAANAQYNTMNANIGSGQYTAQMVAEFSNKIQTAQAVYDKADATQAEVNIAIANLYIHCCSFGPPGSMWWLQSSTILTPNPFGKVGASLVRFGADNIGMDPVKDNLLVLINGVETRFTSHNGIKKFVVLVDNSFSELTFAEGTPKELKYGDVNLNNAIDSTDINLLKGAVAGNRVATENFEHLASDVTGDGAVNASDYNTFKGLIAGNLVDLPVYSK